ncbi:DUF2059 domain-containing protein [Roseovarius faecimaris]|uniref:DUF2059 domain-containing protein n=1 Tax=Roseovarius faecimaris TaxID=2494550 RepID=A0A6I6IR42_9RHOB|nr:DUF2059 domain-containing protein [Roseovarius faecimaris]QGX98544.1 DUF2059 domain-containing protein [Roseovarius faecimaris]
MNLRAVLAPFALILTFAGAALADRAEEIDALMQVLRVQDTIEIMQEEGALYGGEIARDLIPDVDPTLWSGVIEKIYDEAKMHEVLEAGFTTALTDTDLAPIMAYFTTDEVRDILALELSARRAFLDRETEAYAAARWLELSGKDSSLVSQVEELINDSDLVERNVMGTLNADLMFYQGLTEGGAFELSEEEILADVWANEEELRRSTREWLQSFLLMSYQPVDAATLEEYAAFWRTEAGQDLNRAIFVAFDQMYEDLAYLLGLAIAEQMQIEEL